MIVYQHITENKAKTAILIAVFLIFIIGIGFVFSQAYDDPTLLYGAAVFAILYTLISYFFSANITLAISRARPVSFQDNPELYRLVENLAIASGLPTPKIYIIDDTAMNAFATGRNPQNAAMVFTSGIIQRLNKTELEGVVAHELSHIGNYDIRLMTLVVVLVGVLTLLADFFLRVSFFGGGRKGRDNNQLQAVLMIAGIVLAILSPVIATLIQLAISRKREYLADASGTLLTRYPEGLASALEKISADTEPLEAANKSTAHLYIVNPFHQDSKFAPTSAKGRVGAPTWLSVGAGLFNTHPPAQERVKRLREMNR